MWNACKPISVDMASSVSEILPIFCLPLKRPKFPFGPWAILHRGQKIELAQKIHASRSWPERHANQLWWVWPLWFRRFCLFFVCPQNGKISLPTMDYSPSSSKNLIDQNRLKKFMQAWIDVTCMYIDFGGCGLSGFGDTTTLKNSQISLSDHGL